ncbi:tRNA 2-selenouridine(34) synthase MnmH [Alkalicoccus urumqiensis]|uniref:tRNA 2-selenouridine(34) synthase MnmH n=1 Tax=Alkalicoccus urumqiensis TaxID=1548213 RepID=A0A2P6MDV0_ALKUR|nr:tRNA 2-selenouridine(34) synthase MnmH [Alkalicoccus urumqiensis]PRO64462.1 tRNA 2-selenouridine(34) synthase MnmH [Alkalicoccus urumqiensis]
MGRPLPAVTFEEAERMELPVIDVRSPGEFAEFSIPGSINFPLFSNEERAEVGTAYKQKSPQEAKQIGIRMFSEKLPAFYKTMESIESETNKPVVIACARGGMRSGTFVSLLDSLGFDVYQMDGGIRSARRWVQAELDRLSQLEWKAVVISGNTGTRKTIWLEKLAEEGYPVVNLEQLASHRGSIFGHIGMQKRSQKMFEWLLVQRLRELEEEPYILLEAESRRIGPVILPTWLEQVKEEGTFLELEDSMDRRVKSLLEEYEPGKHADAFQEAVDRLKKRLKPEPAEMVDQAAAAGNYPALFETLLKHYYDPRYGHKQGEYVEKQSITTINLRSVDEHRIYETIRQRVDEEVQHHARFS